MERLPLFCVLMVGALSFTIESSELQATQSIQDSQDAFDALDALDAENSLVELDYPDSWESLSSLDSLESADSLGFWPPWWCKVDSCAFCYPNRNTCWLCKATHWLYNNQCLSCIYAIDWCEICSNDGRPCKKCQDGFFLTSNGLCNICMDGISMCDKCSEDGSICYKCLNNYTLQNNKCVYDPQINCGPGKFPLNGQCVGCTFGVTWCDKCSADGKICYSCQNGFHLTNANTCVQY